MEAKSDVIQPLPAPEAVERPTEPVQAPKVARPEETLPKIVRAGPKPASANFVEKHKMTAARLLVLENARKKRMENLRKKKEAERKFQEEQRIFAEIGKRVIDSANLPGKDEVIVERKDNLLVGVGKSNRSQEKLINKNMMHIGGARFASHGITFASHRQINKKRNNPQVGEEFRQPNPGMTRRGGERISANNEAQKLQHKNMNRLAFTL